MTDKQNQRLSETKSHSPQYLGVTSKAFAGNSKAAGIKAKCLDCTGWQRKEITLCGVEACPLWLYRPYQGSSDSEQE